MYTVHSSNSKSNQYTPIQAFAGIVTVSVGHCHPEVTKAIQEQSSRLQHTTTIYLNDQIALYAKELTERMPGNLKVAYFVNSGSEANDMALLMARLYTGNYDIIALRNAYHGLRYNIYTYIIVLIIGFIIGFIIFNLN